MMSERTGTPAPDGPERTPEEAPRDAGAPDDVPAPPTRDDGTVPDKQIRRWKGEGGALHPTD